MQMPWRTELLSELKYSFIFPFFSIQTKMKYLNKWIRDKTPDKIGGTELHGKKIYSW